MNSDLDSLRQKFSYKLQNHFVGREISNMWRMIREDLILAEDIPVDAVDIDKICRDLIKGRPIQHITGKQHFYHHVFFVNEHVLIPRPETEELVDWVLENELNRPLRVLDIGCGSGCIAISLKAQRTQWQIMGMDISTEALMVTRRNAREIGVDIQLVQDDILELDADRYQAFDVIVSNPPYISKREFDKLDKTVRDYEPGQALFVQNQDSLHFYKKIIQLSVDGLLKKSGLIYFECSEYSVRELLHYCNNTYKECITYLRKDLQNKERLLRCIPNP